MAVKVLTRMVVERLTDPRVAAKRERYAATQMREEWHAWCKVRIILRTVSIRHMVLGHLAALASSLVAGVDIHLIAL